MSAPVTIARDPFARHDVIRMVERDPVALRRGCVWCGQLNGYGSLFRYAIDRDDTPGRNHYWGNPFCSVECERVYAS